jgi:hypothetical protein
MTAHFVHDKDLVVDVYGKVVRLNDDVVFWIEVRWKCHHFWCTGIGLVFFDFLAFTQSTGSRITSEETDLENVGHALAALELGDFPNVIYGTELHLLHILCVKLFGRPDASFEDKANAGPVDGVRIAI